MNGVAERLRAEMQRRKQQAAEQYRLLILRSDKPKSGDEALLLDAMQLLGRSPDNFAADAEVVLEVEKLKTIVAASDGAFQAESRTKEQARQIDAWEASELERVRNEAEKRRAVARAESAPVVGRAYEVRHANQRLGELVRRIGEIFSGVEYPSTPQ